MFFPRPFLSTLLLFLWSAIALWAQNSPAPFALKVSSMPKEQVQLVGETARVQLEVQNTGQSPIQEIGYQIEYQGQTSEMLTYYTGHPLSADGSKYTLYLPLPANLPPSLGTLTLHLLRLNNNPNSLSPQARRGSCHLILLKESAPRKVVVEDFTGTWCGYCPAAASTMEILAEDFPQEVIPLAIHSEDLMAIPDCQMLIKRHADGLPTILINRQQTESPYLGKDYRQQDYPLLQTLRQSQQQPSEGAVSIIRAVLSPSGSSVAVSTQTRFLINRSPSPYRLAYLLVADGLSGTSRGWAQNNHYSNNTHWEGLIPQFVKAPSLIPDMIYNHVVVRAPYTLQGHPNSLPTHIEEQQNYTHSYTFDIHNIYSTKNRTEVLIQDKQRLKVVVLLINKETGQIVNADSQPVQSIPSPTSATLSLGEQGWGSIATPQMLTLPEGLKAWTIVPGENSELQLLQVAQAGQHLPSGAGLLIEGEAHSTVQLPFAPSTATPVVLPEQHLLKGAFTNGRIAHAEHKVYRLTPSKETGFNFDWQDGTQGEWVSQITGQAYLLLPKDMAQHAHYHLQNGLLTALPSTKATSTPAQAIFDLTGRAGQPHRPGIYIQAGKKILYGKER